MKNNGDGPADDHKPDDREVPESPSVQAAGFREHIEGFMDRIDSLAETAPLSTVVIDSAGEMLAKQCNKFLDDHGTPAENGFLLPPDKTNAYRRLNGRYQRVGMAKRILSRSFVVALVSEFDAFVSGLLRLFFIAQPDALKASERTLTLAELLDFGSIDNARDYIIEKEIETLLRKNPAEQFDALEKKLGIPLRKNLAVWPAFIELTERRNLFVHNDGVVTRHYLDTCQKAGVEVGHLSRGMTLPSSDKYFLKAHEIIFELGVKLGHVMWRKVLPAEREFADRQLAGQIIYNLVFHGRHRLAIVFGDFASETLKSFSSDLNRRILVINRSQAYKWNGDGETALKILAEEDWSASSTEFKMSVAALRDNFPEAIKCMEQMGMAGPVGMDGYREWPVFKELRKQPEFQQKFQTLFGEPLNKVNVPKTTESPEATPESDDDDAAPSTGPKVH